jgi:hypothetical protein
MASINKNITNQNLTDEERRLAAAREDIKRDKDTNPDPITGAPGSHPVGTGIGAAAAGAAGAAIGSVVPGAGTVVGGAIGAVVGAVAGGYAGKGIAEAIDPTAEEAYWRDEHRNRPYYRSDYTYDDDYLPAYRYGYTTRASGTTWNEGDDDTTIREGWERTKAKSRLKWDEAKLAMRDAWNRWDDDEARRRRTTTGSTTGTTGSSVHGSGTGTGMGSKI